ncbi:MAG: hypothetical protein JWM34_2713 [Ilumatobacteraceae bacterium]|nr:hypothetical protein [Ilumatobacteraceae bacterium]
MNSRIGRALVRWVALSCVIGLLAAAAPVRADGWDYVYGDPGPANYSRYQAVKLAPDGSTYMAGFYSGTFNGLSSPNAYRYFFQHINTDGTVAWTQELATPALATQALPAAPLLIVDGLGAPTVIADSTWFSYTAAGVLTASNDHIGGFVFNPNTGGLVPAVAPAADGGTVAVGIGPNGLEVERLRPDLTMQWQLNLAGLADDPTQCAFCTSSQPSIVSVSDGTFWVVARKSRVLVTQQDSLSLVHVSPTGTKIASIQHFGLTPASTGAPILATSDSFIWVAVNVAGNAVTSKVVSFSTADGHLLGDVSSTLPSENVPVSDGVVNCGGLDFASETKVDPNIALNATSGITKRTVLLNGTRLVVTALCRTPAAPPAIGKVSSVLLSYSMSGALGGGYSLTASRELSTASTVYAMDADGAGNAVVVGSTTNGVVYAGPIERSATHAEVAGGNEQAVAARNPLGNLNAVSEYTGLTPTRLFDTRPTEANGAVVVAKTKIGGTNTLTVKVAGSLGIPANGAGAVSLNVTVVDPDGAGYLTVYPCGTPPTASNLNFTAGQTVANAVVAPLSANGEVCFASNVATHVLADVNGWFRSGLGFTAVPPLRVFDTRPDSPQGAVTVEQHPYGGAAELRVKVAGIGGVPATNVGAVSLNVTAVGPDGSGFVTVYPCGTRPNASNLNFVAGQTVPNAVIAPVSANGEVCLFSSVNTHLIADVNGWFAVGSSFNALTPARIVDTRPTEAQGAVTVAKQKYGPSTVLKFTIAGAGGVPATGVSAVALNVTVVDPDAAGYVTVFPCGDRPLASNVNFVAGQTVPNAVVVPVSAAGEVCIFSNTPSYILVDVNGWIGAQ